MLAIILSLIVVSFIFLTLGDLLLSTYNKISRKEESYSLFDTFLLAGLLAISSFAFPSNHYVLSAFLVFCIGYWIVRAKRAKTYFRRIKGLVIHIPPIFLFLIAGAIFAYIMIAVWAPGVFDAFFYHQQNIRWNEEFSAVPGLANLEDRFGFNSNYLLLSALFSFRFLFGEAMYCLQTTVVIWAMAWILYEIARSRFEIKRVLLLFFFMLFFFIQAYTILTTTSTDIVPNIIIFCFFARFILYPQSLSRSNLYIMLVPVMLITLKVSVAPILIISVFALYHLIRNKDYTVFVLLALLSILVLFPWLIRNVIVSGYLVYPIYEIDLFSFDWKLPKEVAMLQHGFVKDCGVVAVDGIVSSLSGISSFLQPHTFISNCVYFIIILSPISFICTMARNAKERNVSIILLYGTLLAIIIFWFVNAPDPRFISGVLYIAAFYAICLLFPNNKEIHLKSIIGYGVISIFVFILFAWGIKRSINYCSDYGADNVNKNKRPIADVFIKPYSYKTQLTGAGIDTDKMKEFYLNNGIIIYLCESEVGGRPVCFDHLPSTVEETNWTSKYQDIKTIEARGVDLQSGFRPKAVKKTESQ